MTKATGILMMATLVALASCSEAKRDKPGKQATAPPATPAPAATAPVDTTPLVATDAKGTTLLELSLPAPRRMGGFALALEWDARAFVLGKPQEAAALKGYLCQPNDATPGQMRYNCVGLPGEDRGGLLASIPVSWRDRPPTADDFKILKNEVVDDTGATLVDVHLETKVAPQQR